MNINYKKNERLKAIINEKLRPLISSNYLYLDVPYHANLGDTLIWQGTLDFLKTLPYKCLHSSWYNSTKYKDIADKNPNCLIILHGGGNFGDVWIECHKFRKKVIEDLPNHRIIIFPQTIYYQEEKNLKADAEFFSKYPNVTICARDRHSLKTLNDYFPHNPSLLVPDMAFFMDEHWFKPETTEDRTLFLMRTDHELKAGESLNIPEGADISDWPTLNSFGGKLRYDLLRRLRFGLNHVDRLLGSNIEQKFTDFYWKKLLRPYNVKLVVDFLQSYKHIYTTRMHAGILGVILGKTDINIYDNAYGKMSWFYETWLSDVEGIRMLNNNSKNEERLHYIDVMKGITMLVVVLHHVLWITVDLKNVTNSTMLFLHGWQDMLASFIMPAFFFCTGYCSSFNKAFKPFFISNFKSLLVPSITVGIAYEIIYGRILQLPSTLNMAMHQGFLFFWFLYALFYGKMIFWMLIKFVKKARIIIAILLILAFVATLCNDINFLGWNFMQYRQTLNLILYLGIGYYFKNFPYQNRMLNAGVLLFVAGVALSRIIPFVIPRVTAGFNCTLTEEPLHIFYALTGTLLVMWISKKINKNLCLEEIGKKSLIIYVIHNTIILHSTDWIFQDMLQKTNSILFVLLIVLVMVSLATAISYMICVALNTKYLKWTLGKF